MKPLKYYPKGLALEETEIRPKKSRHLTLIYFGGLRSMKRVNDQIEAVAILKNKYPNIMLNILGNYENATGKKLQKMVHNLKLESNICFVGRVTEQEKRKYITQSYLNLYTSIKEGWGLTISEAGKLAVPSVGYNVSGLRDSIIQNKTGLLTKKNTPKDLASCIEILINNPEKHKILSINAQKFAEKLDWDKTYLLFKKSIKIENRTSLQMPLVSVIVPTLHSEKYLRQTLESIKNQTYKNIEIIMVDGGSKDNTLGIAEEYGVRIIKTKPNRSSQKNLGAKNAQGEYIYFVDSDFILNPAIIKNAVEQAINENFDSIEIHNSSDPSISFWSKVRKFERDFYFRDIHAISPRFLKKSVFEALEGFNESAIAGEDYDLFNRLRKQGYSTGYCKYSEMHLGEPQSLKEIWNKHYFYGQTLAQPIAGSKKIELTMWQKIPLKPSYFKKCWRFALHPVLTAGFCVYQGVRYTAAICGALNNKFTKKRQVKDRTTFI